MKRFTMISERYEMYAIPKAGYKFDFSNGELPHHIYSGEEEELIKCGLVGRLNYISAKIDDMYDLDCTVLCQDENGDLYGVYFDGNDKPLCWQKVRRMTEEEKEEWLKSHPYVCLDNEVRV